MKITGSHVLLYSRDPEADRAFLRDVLELGHVDAGGGWLIFGLPPAEVGVHPMEDEFVRAHAGQDLMGAVLYLMCEDLEEALRGLSARGVQHSEIEVAEWGSVTSVQLPSGGRLGLYQPAHPTALHRG